MGTFQWDEWIVKTWVVRAHEEAQGPGGRGQEKQSVEPVLQSLFMHSGFKMQPWHSFLHTFLQRDY